MLSTLISIYISKNIKRYLRVFIKKQAIILIIIGIAIGYLNIKIKNKTYEDFNKIEKENNNIIGVVLDYKETEYGYTYTIKGKTKGFSNKKILVYTSKNCKLDIGDLAKFNLDLQKISERRNYKGGSLSKKLNKTNSSKYIQLNENDFDINKNENNKYKNIKPFKLPILHKNNSMKIFPQIKFNPKLNMDYLKNRIYAQKRLNLTRNATFFNSPSLVQKIKNTPLKKSQSTGFLLSPISNVLIPKNTQFNTIQRNQNIH